MRAPADDFLPITQRKRVSIIDVLQAADINTKLYSNQGNTGTWNYASSIIFGNSQSKFSNENNDMSASGRTNILL